MPEDFNFIDDEFELIEQRCRLPSNFSAGAHAVGSSKVLHLVLRFDCEGRFVSRSPLEFAKALSGYQSTTCRTRTATSVIAAIPRLQRDIYICVSKAAVAYDWFSMRFLVCKTLTYCLANLWPSRPLLLVRNYANSSLIRFYSTLKSSPSHKEKESQAVLESLKTTNAAVAETDAGFRKLVHCFPNARRLTSDEGEVEEWCKQRFVTGEKAVEEGDKWVDPERKVYRL